ncbi:MAG: ATP-dependent protease [Sphingomonadales bacterium CG12_big_fil_rev_8_21_14_0_65_65_10]|jgi:uncharacterized protein|uniref:ATP-dependent protease n=1 Tax=Blastomonas marina TaxID=1867408 RepID=A0ABQ1F312_9SPHN|nr:LON peptidase substrate-binding domain-containing protein [Blastomonas marina]PIW55853.1 MAG: ATP-dependent protease [Sphingomonadales bacterium CG12_big_fil_rev_8_21_14_0_65_65_10]GFZ97998.1 ATP-dependent protease [Blastomonas marina]
MATQRISIFPLPGAILFPGLQLPLHIFEPRYRALVTDALARNRQIGMIQPERPEEGSPLFKVGCIGRIGDVETTQDGRFDIVLEGVSRFAVVEELDVTTQYRQVTGELIEDPSHQTLSAIARADFEREARRFADAQGYSVDWGSVSQLDDETLIDGVSQIAPFDHASKQALLEADDLASRCELLVQLMQFYGKRDGDEGRVTLQ